MPITIKVNPVDVRHFQSLHQMLVESLQQMRNYELTAKIILKSIPRQGSNADTTTNPYADIDTWLNDYRNYKDIRKSIGELTKVVKQLSKSQQIIIDDDVKEKFINIMTSWIDEASRQIKSNRTSAAILWQNCDPDNHMTQLSYEQLRKANSNIAYYKRLSYNAVVFLEYLKGY